MLGFANKRFFALIAGILLLIIGLFFQNPLVGLGISILIAFVVFYDEKLSFLFLLIFVPIRPFLTVYNSGFKLIGDLIILLLLLKIFYDNRKDIRELFRFHAFEYAFFAFLLVGTISALITGVSLSAIVIQLRAFGLFYLLFYIVKRMNVADQDVKDFSWTTLIFAVFLSLQGLVEKISVRTLFLPEEWQAMELAYTNAQRVYGLMGGPNETGMFLLISIFIGFSMLNQYNGKVKNFLYGCLILIGAVFILTYSRGAGLTLIVFFPIYWLVTRNLKFLKPLLIIGISASLLYLVVERVTTYVETYQAQIENLGENGSGDDGNYEKGIKRFSGAFSDENLALSNADGRVYYLRKSLEVFKDRPLMGYGFGTYGGSATLIYSSPIYEQYGIYGKFYSDNQYSQLIAETGILGIITMLAFVTSLIKITWDLRKGYEFSPILIYFIVGAVVSGLVYNILENDVYTMFYFIILGYAYQFRKKTKSI